MLPKSERFEIRVDPGLLARIDEWSEDQSDRPSRAEAMRRLVEVGLKQFGAGKNVDFRPTPIEKLTLWMLAEVIKNQPNTQKQDTADLVQEVIYGGHYWALALEMTGVLHNHEDNPQAVKDVMGILDMWSFIESGFSELSMADKDQVAEAVGPTGKNPKFQGFDGNHEAEYMGIASFLVQKLGRFERFKERSFNSHCPTVARYKKMAQKFEEIRQSLIDRGLSARELIELLRRDEVEL